MSSDIVRLRGRDSRAYINEDGIIFGYYHGSLIVDVHIDKITLDCYRWATSTTKRKMNEVSDRFDLGYRVTIKKGIWQVRTREGFVLPFVDGKVEFPYVKQTEETKEVE